MQSKSRRVCRTAALHQPKSEQLQKRDAMLTGGTGSCGGYSPCTCTQSTGAEGTTERCTSTLSSRLGRRRPPASASTWTHTTRAPRKRCAPTLAHHACASQAGADGMRRLPADACSLAVASPAHLCTARLSLHCQAISELQAHLCSAACLLLLACICSLRQAWGSILEMRCRPGSEPDSGEMSFFRLPARLRLSCAACSFVLPCTLTPGSAVPGDAATCSCLMWALFLARSSESVFSAVQYRAMGMSSHHLVFEDVWA